MNWKSAGWNITRKLLYYALVVLVSAALFIGAFNLMTVASTISFAIGLLIVVLTVGGLVTLGIREAMYYLTKFNKETE